MSLVADDKAIACAEPKFSDGFCVLAECGGIHASARGAKLGNDRRKIAHRQRGKPEDRAHGGAKGFGVIELGAIVAEDQPINAERGTASKYRSEVSRIAQRFCDEQFFHTEAVFGDFLALLKRTMQVIHCAHDRHDTLGRSFGGDLFKHALRSEHQLLFVEPSFAHLAEHCLSDGVGRALGKPDLDDLGTACEGLKEELLSVKTEASRRFSVLLFAERGNLFDARILS